MGCDSCRQREPEANFPFFKDLEKNPEKIQNFQEEFDKLLEQIGEYYDSDFNSLLPQNIQDYINNNNFQVKEEYYADLEGIYVKPVKFKNGNVYEGGWNKKFNMEGKGKYFLKEENMFLEGIWKEGNLIYTRLFIITGDNFNLYEGEMKDSKFNGKGTYTTSSGRKYKGEFLNNEIIGKVELTFEDSITTYEGPLEKYKLKGEGKMIWKNGYEYEGSFDDNKLSGHGILKGPNDEVYEGDFSNNLFSGNGKYTYQNGNTYEGQFSYGVKKGRGIYKCLGKFEYEGGWDNDLPSGIGKLSTWDKSGIIKSSWKYGKIMEEAVYEKGTKDDFEGIDFNFVTDEMMINIKDLTNLENIEIQTTQYKLGTEPSFLDDE